MSEVKVYFSILDLVLFVNNGDHDMIIDVIYDASGMVLTVCDVIIAHYVHHDINQDAHAFYDTSRTMDRLLRDYELHIVEDYLAQSRAEQFSTPAL